MTAIPKANEQRKQRAVTCTLTLDQFAQIDSAANAAGITRSEWARQQLVKALVASAHNTALGIEHAQLFLEQLILIETLLEESLERSIPGATPLTKPALSSILDRIDEQKASAARTLLAVGLTKPPLPFERG